MTGLTPDARAALRKLCEALPAGEWRAVRAWLATFYPFQLEWLLDWGRFSLLNKARQIGASHSYGGAGALWAVLGETTTFVSVGEREAAEVLKKGARHLEALARMGSVWAEPVRQNSQEVETASGGRLVALPATSGGRGYSGNVVLDEFAYHEHPEEVWDGAAATVLHGFRLRALSTPNGVGNLWHQIFSDPAQHAGYRLHEVTIDQARAQGLQVEEGECWKMARGDVRVYEQLFRCKFLDNEAQYIPTGLVNEALRDETFAFECELYAGLDVGRTADRTVLVILARDALGILWVQSVQVHPRTDDEGLQKIVDGAMAMGVHRLCVDSTGLGAFPAERMQRRHGQWRVEPIVFTMPSKEALATGLYQFFADKMIRLPRGEKDLQTDIMSIKRIVTNAGGVRYDAATTAKGHADRAWALALAVHASGGVDRRRYEVRDPPAHAVREFA